MTKQTVILTGLNETISAVDKFDKGAVLKFEAVIESELGRAAAKASRFIPASPMTGWHKGTGVALEGEMGSKSQMRSRLRVAQTFSAPGKKRIRGGAGWPEWDQAKAIRGIKVSRKPGRARGDYTTSAGALIQEDAAGAIFEIAGRKTVGDGARGIAFVNNLSRFGRASRGIWRAVDEDRKSIELTVFGALEELKRTLQRHLEEQRG